jgi:hypothetical protein
MKQLQAQVCGKNGQWRNVGRQFTTIRAVNGYLRKYLSGRSDVWDSRIVNVVSGTVFAFNAQNEWIA